MKKLTLVMIMIGSLAYAGEKDKSTKVKILPGNETGIYKVHYYNPEEQKVQIRIRDHKGRILMTDFVYNDSGFAKMYNMQQLKPGSYVFEIKDEEGKTTDTVFIKPQTLFAVRHIGEERYQVRVSKNISGTVDVNIFGDEGKVIHKDKVNAVNGFSRIYDLSQVSGFKSITIKTDSESKQFTLK